MGDFRSRIDQDKTAGAVGGFDIAGGKTGLADAGGLLVARHAQNGNGFAEEVFLRDAEIAGTVADLRQHGARYAEQPQQVGIPIERFQIQQHGA